MPQYLDINGLKKVADRIDEVEDAASAGLETKQDTLVSGINIKTINSLSVLGSGNIDIQPYELLLDNGSITSSEQTNIVIQGTISNEQKAAILQKYSDILAHVVLSSIGLSYYLKCSFTDGQTTLGASVTNIQNGVLYTTALAVDLNAQTWSLEIRETALKTIDGQSIIGTGNLESVETIELSGASGTLTSAQLAAIVAYPQRFVIKRDELIYVLMNVSSTTVDYSLTGFSSGASIRNEISITKASGNWVFNSVIYHDSTKQDTLVSGTNIKTINNNSVLGSGNIDVSPTTATTLEIQRLFRTEYTITTNVTNGSYSGDISIWTKETASVTIIPDTDYVLPSDITVTGASYTYDDTTGVVSLSAATGNVTITAVCILPPPPAKGDIIHFDALGDGTQKRFRVIDVDSGNTVKLLGLDNSGNSTYNTSSRTIAFDNGSSYQNYEDSDLDNYLNTTYYNSLSSTVKSAIIDETLVQSCYSKATGQSSSATFNIKRLDNDEVNAYTRTTQRTVGLRHVHAIELDEIKAYFNASTGDLIQGTAINELFFEQTTGIARYIWCASADAGYYYGAFAVLGSRGYFSYDNYYGRSEAHPVFKINLSTISYTKE